MTSDSHALTTTEHSPVAGLAHDAHGGISNPILGMLLFITSEVMFFAGLFAAYFGVRANAPLWPPLNPETGAILARVEIPEPYPEPHGMTLWEGYFWYCDAHSRAVCRLPLPSKL